MSEIGEGTRTWLFSHLILFFFLFPFALPRIPKSLFSFFFSRAPLDEAHHLQAQVLLLPPCVSVREELSPGAVLTWRELEALGVPTAVNLAEGAWD